MPYSDKMKQLLKMKFLVNEHKLSVMYIVINAIPWFIYLNVFKQDECFVLKAQNEQKLNMLSQIWKHHLPDLGDLSLVSFCQSRAA